MTDVLLGLVVFGCLLAYGLALNWSLREQEAMVAAWREDERPEDRER